MLALPEYSLSRLDVIHQMDALTLLRGLAANSIDCVVTSPPYYALRDYGVQGQIGLEATPQLFIERLMTVFREVRRVLKPTGSVWVNLGDSYSGGGGYYPDAPSNQTGRSMQSRGNRGGERNIKGTRSTSGLPDKSLMMIPARFAIAMQDEGWILRSEIVWAKRAPMPESVTDRPTKAHEMIYLFAKEPRYFYDQEAVREPVSDKWKPAQNTWEDRKAKGEPSRRGAIPYSAVGFAPGGFASIEGKRNMRDVWHLSPEPSTVEHFAAYPTEIPRRCILAGCPEKVCAECGKPYERVVERQSTWQERKQAGAGAGNVGVSTTYQNGVHGRGMSHDLGSPVIDRGLHPTCSCNAGTRAGIVLDMFAGTGTTLYMARKLGRHYIGGDLNRDYVDMARRRLAQSDPFMDRQITPELKQKSMFAGIAAW